MKNIKRNNIIISGAIFILLITSTLSIVNSETIPNKEDNNSIDVRIYNTQTGILSEKNIDREIYNVLFEKSNEKLNDMSFSNFIKNKINLLVESGCINYEEGSQLINKYNIFKKFNNQNYLIGNYDVLNLFNGIFFRLDGEKINSFLDLYVLNLPLLNKNISALFSVLTEVQGNGYAFTLGVFGFQYIFNSSLFQDPRFSEIEGSIIGFTGILIESNNEGLTQDESTIMGIGMSILTSWNEL